jgi:hypothetical protein
MAKIQVETKHDFAFFNAKASLEIEGHTLPNGGEELILERINTSHTDRYT